MIDLGPPSRMGLSTFFTYLSMQEMATIGPLMLSLASLLVLWVLLRRQLRRMPAKSVVSGVDSTDAGTQVVNEVVQVQRELRELVREFSVLADRVLQALDRDRALTRLPHAGGAALQLVDLGLTPAEAARATEMTVGEVALLMNLRKAKDSKLYLSDVSSIKGEDVAVQGIDCRGEADYGRIGMNDEH